LKYGKQETQNGNDRWRQRCFIGAIHRFAFNMDAQVELVAGALSINPEIAVDSGKVYFLMNPAFIPIIK
jgi:hypothetical protein